MTIPSDLPCSLGFDDHPADYSADTLAALRSQGPINPVALPQGDHVFAAAAQLIV